MLLISTSRRPSDKTRRFCNSLKVIPYSYRKNRGSSSIKDLLGTAYADGFSRCIIVNTRYGNPAEMVFYEDKEKKPFKFVMQSVKMREHSSGKHRTPKFTSIEVKVDEELESSTYYQLKKFFEKKPQDPFEDLDDSNDKTLLLRISKDPLGMKMSFYDKETKKQFLPVMKGFLKVD